MGPDARVEVGEEAAGEEAAARAGGRASDAPFQALEDSLPPCATAAWMQDWRLLV